MRVKRAMMCVPRNDWGELSRCGAGRYRPFARARSAPAAEFHPAQERLERRDPDDAGGDVDDRLERPVERADLGGEAGDQDNPESDEREDREHADGLAPGGFAHASALS